jgi:hypothetical protein
MLNKKNTNALIFGGIFITLLGFRDDQAKFIPSNVKIIVGVVFLIIGVISLIMNYLNSKNKQ